MTTPVTGWWAEPLGDMEPPTAPSLTVGEVTKTSISVTASGATDDTAVTSDSFWQDGVRQGLPQADATYMFDGLKIGTEYSLAATALDAEGNESPKSAPVDVTTLDYVWTDGPMAEPMTDDIDQMVNDWLGALETPGV